MEKLILILTLAVLGTAGQAQDIIIKKNTDEIECKVLEIEQEVIKYKKYSNLDGPTYSISKEDIFMVKYENGEKEVFKTEEKEPVVDNTVDTRELPYRAVAIRAGISAGNIFNAVMVNEGTITTNSNYAFTLNSFFKNRRFSSSVTFAPYNIISEDIDIEIDGQTYETESTEQVKGYALLGEFYVHYALKAKSSLYTGIGSGFMIINRNLSNPNIVEDFDESLFTSSFHLTLIGAEYYVIPNLGMYSELGVGRKGLLSFGLQLQF
jgi:opacity protein-like surface antigen